MHRLSWVAALVLLSAHGAAAQAGTPAPNRSVLVPQLGGVVRQSENSNVSAMLALTGELPVGRGWSLTGEAVTRTDPILLTVCHADPCGPPPAALRQGAAVGVTAYVFRTGPLSAYAGASAGAVRWKAEEEGGVAPMAALRAGLDVQVIGRLGVRPELVRRVAWTGRPREPALYADVFSLGARFAIGR